MKANKYTSATDLAEMGYCEKKVLFKARLGERLSPERAAACRKGLETHQAFHRDAVRIAPAVYSSEPKPWCFIASELFGDTAVETRTLRQFRDQVLRRTVSGRAFIRFYYRHSPAAALWLRRYPAAKRISRDLLRVLIWGLRAWPGTRAGDRGTLP